MKSKWKIAWLGVKAGCLASVFGSFTAGVFFFVVTIITGNLGRYLIFTSISVVLVWWILFSLMIISLPAVFLGIVLAFRLHGHGLILRKAIKEGSILGGMAGFLFVLSDIIFVYPVSPSIILGLSLASLLGIGMGAFCGWWLEKRLETSA